ncbi:MAG: proline--tRNA ligase [Erysipelotrichaceae bacterium]
MKLSNSFFYTIREDAKDEESNSGNLLVRSGMIKKSSNGIYTIMPLGMKVLHKIENIVREEMDAADAQELLMPALILEEVYEKSGRREAFGSNMFALKDRNNKNYVLGPTHEELFVLAASMKGKSYKDFPYTLYQMQTKYRDETRPRYGLIRVREFIMKDAYSFDIDNAGLDISYMKMFNAYKRIFDRMNLNYKIVQADTGAMGGMLSEEFQAITPIGEDTVVACNNCDFSSNLEITAVVDTLEKKQDVVELDYELVETPNAKTIEEVAAFFNTDTNSFVKTLIYKVDNKDLVAFLLRGNRELNETKATKILGALEMELASFADVEKVTNAKVGFAGPINLDIKIVMDNEVKNMTNFICGANKTNYHFKNANLKDFKADIVADIASVHEGDICPICGQKLVFSKGIEVGNTFKLGTKYTQALGLQYLDANNNLNPVVMGSYGIGLERCMAAVVEQHSDENGINWPTNLAPFSVAIVLVKDKDEAAIELANNMYKEFKAAGIEVLLDDRKERAGVKFKDMELIGIPVRITIGKRYEEGIVEIKRRKDEAVEEVSTKEVLEYAMKLLKCDM